MPMKKKKKKVDDGQIWSSYSDMFTTMAIIFLTMFVFAMVKVGVSTMERIAQKKTFEKELEGSVSKVDKEKNKKKIEIMITSSRYRHRETSVPAPFSDIFFLIPSVTYSFNLVS